MKSKSSCQGAFRLTAALLGLGLSVTLTAQLQPAWVRTYNYGAVDGATALSLDAQANVYVTGFSVTNNNDDYVTIKYAPDGSLLWSTRYAGPADAFDSPVALAVNAQGDSWVTGTSRATNGNVAYATIRYDSTGVPVWVQRLEALGNDVPDPAGLVVDNSGNVYVAGSRNAPGTGHEFLLAKYSGAGTLLWTRRHGAGFEARATSLVLDGAGHVIVTGNASGAGDSSDILIAKWDAAGNHLWSARYDGMGNTEQQWAEEMCIDGSGNIYIAGGRSAGIGLEFLTLKYSPSGQLFWDRSYSGKGFASSAGAVQVGGGGHVYVTGGIIYAVSNNWAHDTATVKYDANGNQLWSSRFSGEAPGYPTIYSDVLIDAAGDIYVTDTYGFGLMKYGAAGNLIWSASQPAGLARALALDGAGNLFQAGQRMNATPSAPFDYYDFLVAKYTQSNDALQPVAFVNPSQQEAIVGSNVTFTGSVTGPGPFTYQWRFNGRPIPNATGPELVLAAVPLAAAGDYSIIVSNAAGYTISPEARLILRVPPTIASPAQTNKVIVGETNTWAVAVSGDPPLSYRWLFNGVEIPGATNAILTMTNLQESASGLYTIVVTNTYGIATSAPYQLTVIPSTVTISLKGSWPAAPRTNGFARAVRVVGNRAYLADSFAGLQIIDVSDPANPVWLGRYETGGIAQDVEVVGTVAYVSDVLTGLHLVDVTDPAHPIGISVYDTSLPGIGSESPHALRVVNNLAFVADGHGPEVHVVDVSNPTLPVRVGAIPFVAHVQGLDVVSNHLYLVGSRLLDEDNNIGFIQIFNVSEPTNAVLVGTTDTDTRGHGVAVTGSHAYVVGEETALTSIDVSNPASPTPLGHFSTYGWAEAIHVLGNRAYIAGEYMGLAILDVSDPAIPFRLAQYPLGTGEDEGWDVQVVGQYAYLARGFAGLLIFEIAEEHAGLSIVRTGDQVRISWKGEPGVKLQRSSVFANPDWEDVPGSTGTNNVQLPVGNAPGCTFFRLMKP